MRTTHVPAGSVDIWVSHKPPPSYPRFPYNGLLYYKPRPPYVVGRSMVESSVLPREWLDHFARVDEVWVPSNFLMGVFEEAGIPRDRLHCIPESVDVHFYNPELTDPLSLPKHCAFNFLSVFLEAFAREFSAEEGVCLFIQTYAFQGREKGGSLEATVDGFLADLKLERKPPPVILLTRKLPKDDMPRLYKAAHAFVLPSRGEGWGLPMMEAMAMGLPTISTNFSGMLEFMTERNSFLIRVSEMVAPRDKILYKQEGLLWAQPSGTHLRELLRLVVANPLLAREVGRRARDSIVKKFSEELISERVMTRLVEIKDLLTHEKGSG